MLVFNSLNVALIHALISLYPYRLPMALIINEFIVKNRQYPLPYPSLNLMLIYIYMHTIDQILPVSGKFQIARVFAVLRYESMMNRPHASLKTIK